MMCVCVPDETIVGFAMAADLPWTDVIQLLHMHQAKLPTNGNTVRIIVVSVFRLNALCPSSIISARSGVTAFSA